MTLGRLSLLSALLLVGCIGGSSDDDDSDDGIHYPDAAIVQDSGVVTDAGQTADGGSVSSVEIGTGIEDFESMIAGQQVMIIAGPQGGGRYGGFHIWNAVRVKDFDPAEIMLDFRTYLASTHEELASQQRIFDLIPGGNGTWIAYGIAPPFVDCCQAEDLDVIMSVLVTDSTGKTGTDERTVHAMQCNDFSGASVCP